MTFHNESVLRTLEIHDLPKVAELHQRAFEKSALTRLGLEPVRRYYEWLLTGPHDSISIGIYSKDNTLHGFCFAGIYKGALSGYLQHNRQFLAIWFLKHPWLIFNELVFDRIQIALKLIRKRIKKSTEIKEVTPRVYRSFGVLAIATDPNYQGLGVGTQLMDAVEKHARACGFSHLHLSVHPENKKAIDFYIKCGWQKSSNAPTWDGRMTKVIDH